MSNFQGIRVALRLLAATALSLFVAFGASAQTVRYIHTDGLGSVVLVTDKDRNIVERSEYEPYGSLLNRPTTDGPGYTGHIMDASTGLAYMQQRYYDPSLGRFLSSDPDLASKTPGQNFNRYWYANSNPFKFTDPDGRRSETEDQRDLDVLITGIDSKNTPATMSDGERLVAAAFGGVDLVYGSSAMVDHAVGGLVSAANPLDGPILDVAAGASILKDAVQTLDGLRSVLSALDGKERPTTLEQAGGMFGGEQGAKAGKILNTVITFHGGAKAFANPEGTVRDIADVMKPIFEKNPDSDN
ncbi:hypothetical protein NB688_000405 [Xanthomonas sacchari]|uniref:Teneurin-like YD-shell domain-containing protein n=1 Tax=Xanthomonas sacchari TaxID=56458 RepID=A0ABT3DWK5_9XANT|nr:MULTISPECIES: RHS repeat-associated core domain-containing protein [Xanthomonas]MCW0399900.1 hypothetical protein [Xanthomonas sacchari]MCW0418239.1 hypothetical protein [Xanthomonas sacchari]MDQ7760279.1 RHS repeat-associated core domain-containing protein [Xanthomonas sontii]TYD34508.1 hypothetical protein CEK63_11500 [Xanthomonas sontii]UYK72693.1 RHS repeat-associated core domain-containing protein [Xanthomonas sacchari]